MIIILFLGFSEHRFISEPNNIKSFPGGEQLRLLSLLSSHCNYTAGLLERLHIVFHMKKSPMKFPSSALAALINDFTALSIKPLLGGLI